MPVRPSKPDPQATRPELDRNAGAPLFEQVAERIEGLIRSGTLAVGQRIPSVRRARQQFGVSASTVVEAYRLLEDRGLIRARPQSGYFVRQALPQTRRTAPGATSPRMRSVPVDPPSPALVQFRAAIPDPTLLPTAQLTRTLGRIYRERPETLTLYGPSAGCEELRRAIARRMIDAGCAVSPDEVVVTNGATEAVAIALQALTNRGDTVAVESPTYHGLLDALRARGLRVLPLAASADDGLSVDAFEEAVRTHRVAAAVVIANFANPLGGLMPDAHKRRLVEVARRHGVPVLEDDIYGEIGFEGARPLALRGFDDGSTVIYCSSFSKVLSPGLRIGWCVPGARLEDVKRLKQDLNVSTPMAPQLAIAEMLDGGGFDRHLRALRRTYQTQVARFADRVLATFPEGTRVTHPRGGHVIWVEMPKGVDAVRLLDDCTRRGVTFAPGPLFAPDGSYRNFLRLNCAVPWSDRVADAVRTIGDLAARQLAPDERPPGLARPLPRTSL